MTVFRPLATSVYQRLENSSEDDARSLLEARVRQHFE
jgi:hypothetical protein